MEGFFVGYLQSLTKHSGKVGKPFKTGQEQETLTSGFAWCLTAIAKNLFFEGKLEITL